MCGTNDCLFDEPSLTTYSRSMKTWPVLKKYGNLCAFEIRSTPFTFRRIFRVLQTTEGVSDVKRNGFSVDHVTVSYRGEPFVINELWGDSSRRWVGPQYPEISKVDLTSLHKAFQDGLLRKTCATPQGWES